MLRYVSYTTVHKYHSQSIGGELMKYIYKCGKLTEDETRKYIRQLVSAVDHLHKAGLIHR